MPDVSGFLNLNKPRGPSSFAFVSMVRRLTGIRRVGHGGTLDPLADGVLPLCLGQATRMMDHLLDGRKEYRARVRLGITTDTYDAEGDVVAERDASGVSLRDVEALLPRYAGSILQVPPMYSALKQGGRTLYSMARQGLEVERAPRPVQVYRIEVTAWEPPHFTLEVECSRGTYIRSLAYDLGEALGCGAHLAALTRTRVGPFRIEDAVTPDELTEAVRLEYWEACLYPIDMPVLQMPAAILDQENGKAIQEGRLCAADESAAGPHRPRHEELCRAYGADGSLLALIAYDEALRGWKPAKVFVR